MGEADLAGGTPLAEGADPVPDPLRSDYILPDGRGLSSKAKPHFPREKPPVLEPGIEYESAAQHEARMKAKGERLEQIAKELAKKAGKSQPSQKDFTKAVERDRSDSWAD